MTDERQPAPFGPAPFGLALREPHPWSELSALAPRAEDLGAGALFLPEIASRDTLAALTGLAGETAALRLGTGVVPVHTRSPQLSVRTDRERVRSTPRRETPFRGVGEGSFERKAGERGIESRRSSEMRRPDTGIQRQGGSIQQRPAGGGGMQQERGGSRGSAQPGRGQSGSPRGGEGQSGGQRAGGQGGSFRR